MKIPPEWALRVGFGVMYLYSGSSLLLTPSSWAWALPLWLKNIIGAVVPVATYLQLQGVGEIAIALVLFSSFVPRKVVTFAAAISTLEMAGILVLAFFPWNAGQFLITFRDIGLLGGSFALLVMLWKNDQQSPQFPA